MPRRKLPSPEEYGRRLADAKRRQEKQRHEAQKRTDDGFRLVLEQLEQHMQSLEALKDLVNDLDRDVVSPGALTEVTDGVLRKLADIESTIAGLNLDVPAPVVPKFPTEALDGVLSELRSLKLTPPPPRVDPAVPLDPPQPPESILSGPVTLTVTGRDTNGDIDTIRVEPTRH